MITSSDIKKLFEKQLALIKDPELVEKVVDTWVLACSVGDWKNVEELKKIPFTLLTDTQGISFIQHTAAVTDGAYALAKAQLENYQKMPYKIDFDRLVAGALLHDVGKLLEIEPDGKGGYRKSLSGKCTRHPISGAILAAQMGLDEKLINTIACHAKEGEGRP
ncbi:MAG TPA: HDIG domain-containing protein, partial [Thermoplasmata archaeon]|nr:HDIG domain-containing protein [Thermoplasmata archaeon]